MFNVSTTSSTSSSSVTTNINAINASSSALYLDQNPAQHSGDTNASNEVDASEPEPIQMGEIITADDFNTENEVNGQLELTASSNGFDADNGKSQNTRSVATIAPQKQKAKVRAARESTVDNPTVTTAPPPLAPEATKTTTISGKELRNSVKQEASDSTAMDIESTSEKRASGFKVLSNVQVSSNAILNVSLNSKANEPNALNNMIIVSSLPSTSAGATAAVQQPPALLSQLPKPQSLLKNSNESRTSSDTRNSKNTKANVEVSVRNHLKLLEKRKITQKITSSRITKKKKNSQLYRERDQSS